MSGFDSFDAPSRSLRRLQVTRSMHSLSSSLDHAAVTRPDYTSVPTSRSELYDSDDDDDGFDTAPVRMRSAQSNLSSSFSGSRPRSRARSAGPSPGRVPPGLRKTTVEAMMNKTGRLPKYDALSDPHLQDYFRRKFGWSSSALASGSPHQRLYRQASEGRPKTQPKAAGTYEIKIKTASDSSSRTKSRKYATLFGSNGKSSRLMLTGPGADFTAGSVATFTMKCRPALGDLTQIKLENDCFDARDAWRVERVIVRHGSDKTVFPGGVWLSKFHGDKQTKRVLRAASAKATDYEIEVFTGDVKFAGTDATVYLTMYGTDDSSRRLRLRDNRKCFQTGSTDKFIVQTPPLGELQKIRIEHDNKGVAPGWFLEKIIVKQMNNGKMYPFPCHNWLSKRHGDKQIARELVVDSAGGEVEYTIATYTGDVRYAGTDARVFIILFGNRGETGPHRLDTPKNNFERKMKDVFHIRASNVGTLERVRIYHDNTGIGPGWFLDKVVVSEPTSGQEAVFPCERWLAKDADDGQISRELTREGGSFGGVQYKLHVTTGDVRFAGTSAQVSCELFGKGASSGRLILKNSSDNFKQGRTDVFDVQCTHLGPLTRLDIGHDNKGAFSGWYLEKIMIEDLKRGLKYEVQVDQWLDVNKGKGETEVSLPLEGDNCTVSEIDRKSAWKCIVRTSDVRGAGTDATVFIVVYGEKGKTDPIPLKSKTDLFERNQTDEFSLSLNKLGKLTKLRVSQDNRGPLAGWHLKDIQLIHVDTQATYTFTCDDWLSSDTTLVRELPATGDLIEEPKKLADYHVTVFTGSRKHAGTSAEAYVIIKGAEGDTGERVLSKPVNGQKFKEGKASEFVIPAVDLGKLKQITIGHDNSGLGAGWFVDKVVVRDPLQDDEVEFPCGRWLARNEEDGQIERVLLRNGMGEAGTGLTPYIIRTLTGDVRGAGTDAKVFVQLYGTKGETGEIALRESATFRDKFERNHVDVFKHQDNDIGDVEKVRVWHDNSGLGAAWMLESIDVEMPSVGKTFHFPCSSWLATNAEDGKIERELYVDKGSTKKSEAKVPYQVLVTTSDVRGAGTDALVSITLYGESSHTDEYDLKSKTDTFERGKTDRFDVEMEDVGIPNKIRVSQNGGGRLPAWHLARIELIRPDKGHMYTFVADRWLSKKAGLTADVPLAEAFEITEDGEKKPLEGAKAASETLYQLFVETSDVGGAGTDANVYVRLHGENSDSGARHLSKSKTHMNKFERGNTDEFEFTAVSLGPLKKLEVWHDNKGVGGSWHLARIRVIDTETGQEYIFPCNRWLSTKHDDRQTARELAVQDEAVPEEFRTNAVTVRYNIEVYTSDIAKAGTDANVHIMLYGDQGHTDKRQLKKSATNRDKFERGRKDVFTIEAVDIGSLTKIRIGHDSGGLGSDWHLDKVVIDAPLLGKRWVFPCNRWLGKKRLDGQTELDLYPAEEATEATEEGDEASASASYKPKVPWEVVFVTGKDRGAGTDATVFVELFGDGSTGTLSSRWDFKEADKAAFEKGKEDRFNIELDDVGVVSKLRVGHDAKGIGAAWQLASVRIINQKTKEAYEFECNQWLQKNTLWVDLPVTSVNRLKEDGSIVRGKSVKLKPKNYTVYVHTSDIKGAGTDAGVFLVLTGTKGDSGVQALTKSKTYRDKFEAGHIDEFEFSCLDIGELQSAKVWHNNKGMFASWHLDKIEVKVEGEEGSDGEQQLYAFPCGKWFSKDKSKDGGQLERIIDVFVDPAVAERRAEAAEARAKKALRKAHAASQKGAPDEEAEAEARAAQAQAQALRLQAEKARRGPGAKQVKYTIAIKTREGKASGTKGRVFVVLKGRMLKPSLPSHLEDSSAAENSSVASAGREVSASTGRLWLPVDEGFPAGQTITCDTEWLDVGQLEQAKLGLVGERDNDTWWIESMTVTVEGRPAVNFAPVSGKQLVANKDEEAVLKLVMQDGSDAESEAGDVTYEIEFHVSDRENAGKPGDVQFVLCGQYRESEPFVVPKTLFSQDADAIIRYEAACPALGKLLKARVSFAAESVGQEWFLDKIVARRKDKSTGAIFNADGPLAGGKAFETVHELLAHDAQFDRKQYRVYVYTGDAAGAGTDANVHVQLFGALGTSPDFHLKNSLKHGDKFERGRTDEFEVVCGDLGKLSRCRVRQDGKGMGASWLLDKIVVLDEVTQSSYVFPCGKWLDKKKDGGLMTRDLTCADADVRRRDAVYRAKVFTADEDECGTDCSVEMTLLGDSGASHTAILENDGTKLQRGSSDEFVFNADQHVGSISKMRLTLLQRGSRERPDSWKPVRVEIVDTTRGKMVHFTNAKRFQKSITLVAQSETGDDGDILSQLSNEVENMSLSRHVAEKKTSYKVLVHTGDERGAGTDANVSIILYGDLGDSGERKLAKSKTYRDKFERNHVDEFELPDMPSLGPLRKLKVWHDSKGLGAAWMLDNIRVIDASTGDETLFPCNEWLDKSHGVERILEAASEA